MNINVLAAQQGIQAIADERSENLKFKIDDKGNTWMLWGMHKDDEDFAAQAAFTEEGLVVMNFWGTIKVCVSKDAPLVEVIDEVLMLDSRLRKLLA